MKFDTKSLFLPSLSVNTSFNKDMELDGTIPENSPDITRLIRVDAHIGSTELVRDGEKTAIHANVTFGILYESDYKSKPAYTTVCGDFSVKTDLGEFENESYPSAEVKCVFLSCKLLGPRRFVIRAKMTADLSVMQIRPTEVVDPDSVKINAYFLTDKINCKAPCGSFTESKSVNDTCFLQKPIENIVYSASECGLSEYTAEEGRLKVNTDIRFKALCEAEDGTFFMADHVCKETVLLEDTNIRDNALYRIKTETSDPEAVIETDDYGEKKCINFSCRVFVKAVCYEDMTETIATDTFCGDRTSEEVVEQIEYHSLAVVAERQFAAELNHDTQKTDISAVIHPSVSMNISESSVENGILHVKGTVNADVLTQTASGLVSESFEDQFEESLPVPKDSFAASDIRSEITDINCAVFGGENITLRVNAVIRANIYSAFKASPVVSVNAEDQTAEQVNSLCFYYPDKTESAWNVAKKYRKNPKKLIEDNRNVFEPDGRLKPDAVYVTVK